MALAPLPSVTERFVDAKGAVTPRWRAYLQRIEQQMDALEAADAAAIQNALLTTRGDLIARDATAPARLAIGASGRVLTSDGTDPAWTALPASSLTLIASGSFPAAAILEVKNITARILLVKMVGASCDTATRYPKLQFSIDNGVNYVTSGYTGNSTPGSATFATHPLADSIFPTVTTVAASVVCNAEIMITTAGGFNAWGRYQDATRGYREFRCGYSLFGTTVTPLNALKFFWNGSGNFDAGTYEVYGIA